MNFLLPLLVGFFLRHGMIVISRRRDERLLRRFQDIVFYGPHRCEDCGKMIVRSAREQGGKAYDYPVALPYPNTEWRLHECFGIPQYTDFRTMGEAHRPPNCSDSSMER